MKKALALGAAEWRKARPTAFQGFDLLYLGDEFCQNLLPTRRDFDSAASNFDGRVVLVTPLLTDTVFDEVERIIRRHASRTRRLEVVANDLGLLHILRQRYAGRVDVSLGRVFGHRVKVMPQGFAGDFLRLHGVGRVELDDASLLPRFEHFSGIRISFHKPFLYRSVTRFCPWESHWPGPCSYSCLGKALRLEHRYLPRSLLLKGAAYGVRTSAVPAHPLLDRLVLENLPTRKKR
jgi:hypothetical protein